MEFSGAAIPLNDADIVVEATKLGCEPAAILAVNDVESAGSGFLPDKRPKILVEAHYFHTLTNGRYDRSDPNISSPVWDRSLYGSSGAHQYTRLAEAIALNRTAALESASWGRFQIMGANFEECGYTDVEAYVQAMVDDEANHLFAFGNFCTASGITRFLISHDWAHFALRYNGSGNVSDYAWKLADAYDRHLQHTNPLVTPPAPGSLRLGSQGYAVVTLQINLTNLGYSLKADGDFGLATETAVRAFQQLHHLTVDGVVGSETANAISVAVHNLP